jgi:hypothetical protein
MRRKISWTDGRTEVKQYYGQIVDQTGLFLIPVEIDLSVVKKSEIPKRAGTTDKSISTGIKNSPV